MPRHGPINNPALKAKARELKKAGWNYTDIGLELGVSITTAHEWTDDDYAEYRHQSKDKARKARQAKGSKW